MHSPVRLTIEHTGEFEGWRRDRRTRTVAKEGRAVATIEGDLSLSIATHNAVQTFCFGSDGLLRRHGRHR